MATIKLERKLKNNGTGCSCVKVIVCLIYIAVIAVGAVIALDALEMISLGIVKDVMRLKVLSVDDYDKLQSEMKELSNDKKEKDKLTKDAQELRNKISSLQMTITEKDKKITEKSAKIDEMSKAVDEKNKSLKIITEERDKLKTKVSDLTNSLQAAKDAAVKSQTITTKPTTPKPKEAAKPKIDDKKEETKAAKPAEETSNSKPAELKSGTRNRLRH